MSVLPQSVLDVWELYQKSVRQHYPAAKASALLAQAKSALCRYTLPGWGFPPLQGKGLTKQETAAAFAFMAALPVAQLAQAAPVQQAVFDTLSLPLPTQRTYRHALLQLLRWCETQPWWLAPVIEPPLPAQRQTPKGSASLAHVTDRRRVDDQGQTLYTYAYGLGRVAGDVIPAALQAELAAFYQYRIAPQGRDGKPSVQPGTAAEEVELLCLWLGWLHRERQVPLDQLCLQQLVPLAAPETTAEPLQADATATVALAEAYLQWLQQPPVVEGKPQHSPRSNSVHTQLRLLRLWQTVAKFVYRDTASQPAGQRPEALVLSALQQRLSRLEASLSPHPSSSLSAAKRLEWEDFQALVESLRQECQPRQWHPTTTVPGQFSPGAQRSLNAIAFSYQRFLFAALLEALPRQRSSFLRRLVLVVPGTAVATAVENQVGVSGFLTLEPEHWCIYPASATTTAPNKIIVPNQCYEDGRCFYTYLEEWLMQYVTEPKPLPGLRSVFQPEHAYLFTKRNGQPYTRANAIKHLLRNPAFRLTGQLPTPETIRLVFED